MKLHKSGWWIPDCMSAPGSYIGRSTVIAVALPYIERRGLALQAGGHIGIWPKILAESFDRVVTVEPEPRNLECLQSNLADTGVEILCGVLGAACGTAKVNYREQKTGGHHVATRLDRPWIEVPMFSIDDLTQRFGVPDAIFLDIEGYEIEALRGAEQTLRHRPVMVIERNSASRKYGVEECEAEDYLCLLGYRRVATDGEDVVLVSGQ